MEKVFPAIRNLAVGKSYFGPRLMLIYRSFLCTAKRFLYLLELLKMSLSLGLAILTPSLVVKSEVIPTSNPKDLSQSVNV